MSQYATDDLDQVLEEVDILLDVDPLKILREVIPKLIVEIRALRSQLRDLAQKSHDADTYDVCSGINEGCSGGEWGECESCQAGMAWRSAYVDVLEGLDELTGDCSVDCLEACAYPGQFSECDAYNEVTE